MAELPDHQEARRRASIYHNATKEASGRNSIHHTVHADVLFGIKGDSIEQAHARLDVIGIPYVRATRYNQQWRLGYLCVNIEITDLTDEQVEPYGFTFL